MKIIFIMKNIFMMIYTITISIKRDILISLKKCQETNTPILM